MHDAHFHMTEELFQSLKVHGMKGIANAESIEEYEMLSKRQQEYSFFISAGVHPWHASMESFQKMKELLQSKEVSLIGEIGLDNVWCDTPMDVQREVFEHQLALAWKIKRPVVLHTKGMEAEIAQRIARWPNTYLVHWYSSMENLEEYLNLNCYFTIGPSVGLDEAVTRVARRIPEDRILIETDGIEAIRWVQDTYPNQLPKEDLHEQTLERSIREIAKIREMDFERMKKVLDENLIRLIERDESCRMRSGGSLSRIH